jgi:putative flippase GtrA
MPAPATPAALREQVTRFLLAGGAAAVVNVLTRIALTPLVGYSGSIVLAFLVGLTTAWLLFRRYVFGPSSGNRAAEYLRFGLVNIAALAQVWVVSVLLADYVFPYIGFGFHTYTVAHVIGVLSPIATSFVAHRRWSFRRSI